MAMDLFKTLDESIQETALEPRQRGDADGDHLQ
jgi:hypothetical protein